MAEILRGLGVGPGDLVALQAFTCVAVPEAIMAIGATPLWIDVDENSVNMSSSALTEAWQDEIKAVVVQHTFGIMADMAALNQVVAGRAPIIEDCCHTYLSSLDGHQAGSFGIASFYSFEWGKPVVLGAGGAAVTKNSSLAAALQTRFPKFKRPGLKKQLKLMLQYAGFSVLYRPGLYWTVKKLFRRLSSSGIMVGNYNPIGPGHLSEDFETRMSKSSDSRLLNRLRKISADGLRRRNLSSIYQNTFKTIPSVRFISEVPKSDNVLIRFPVLVADKLGFLKKAEAQRIEVAEWYSTPIHPLPKSDWYSVRYETGVCPNAEYMANHLISFPMSAAIRQRHVTRAARLFG